MAEFKCGDVSPFLRIKDQRCSAHQPGIITKRRRHDWDRPEGHHGVTPDDVMDSRCQKVKPM